MWLQIDLGTVRRIESVRMYPAFDLDNKRGKGYGFPARFKIEASNNPTLADPQVLVDHTASDFLNPDNFITEFPTGAISARYVRLTATQLRPAQDGVGYRLALARIDVLSAGKDVAEHLPGNRGRNFRKSEGPCADHTVAPSHGRRHRHG
jgi:hypothetical protein